MVRKGQLQRLDLFSEVFAASQNALFLSSADLHFPPHLVHLLLTMTASGVKSVSGHQLHLQATDPCLCEFVTKWHSAQNIPGSMESVEKRCKKCITRLLFFIRWSRRSHLKQVMKLDGIKYCVIEFAQAFVIKFLVKVWTPGGNFYPISSIQF